MDKTNNKLTQLLERYETRIKEGKFVKTITVRAKEVINRFFKKKDEEVKQL